MKSRVVKAVVTSVVGVACVGVTALVMAASGTDEAQGIGAVAATAKSNLSDLAKLLTAGSYVGGMGFGIAAVTQFKAHKDNPTQSPISKPIALLFVAAALLFIPSVFKSTGGTLFESGKQAYVSGIDSF